MGKVTQTELNLWHMKLVVLDDKPDWYIVTAALIDQDGPGRHVFSLMSEYYARNNHWVAYHLNDEELQAMLSRLTVVGNRRDVEWESAVFEACRKIVQTKI